MKTAIAYEVFDFLNVYIFEDFLISNVRNVLYYIYIYMYIFIYIYLYLYIYIIYYYYIKQFTKWKKNRKESKQCYNNDICRWKRDSFSSEVEITRGIV